MSQKYSFLIELLNAWFGGAATTMIGAMVGRLMWHTNEVRKMREVLRKRAALGNADRRRHGLHRRGAGVVADARATDGNGLAALAYLGPRGSEVLFMRWFAAKLDRQG